ncbi:MAG: hypothetical protein CTY12_00670 [Methylotenera sp.]|nr:MAG: hypothetical protein CTY12_00670 [Methylotenera sp.]
MTNQKEIQFLQIDLYEGKLEKNRKVTVDISQPIVPQVLTQVLDIDEEELQREIEYMLPLFDSTSTGYKFMGDDDLCLIIL